MIPSFLIILAGIFSTVIAIYFYSVGIGSIIAVTNGIILLIIGFY